MLLAERTEEVVDILSGWSEADARAMGHAARSRVLDGHTAAHRAAELERHLREAAEADSPMLAHA
jgi:hypothetical protein